MNNHSHQIEMKTFNFYQDQKVTMWNRTYFSVAAPDFEAAKAKLEAYKDDEIEDNEDLGIVISHYEDLLDTSEPMAVEENGGCATLEMFAENGNELMNNE